MSKCIVVPRPSIILHFQSFKHKSFEHCCCDICWWCLYHFIVFLTFCSFLLPHRGHVYVCMCVCKCIVCRLNICMWLHVSDKCRVMGASFLSGIRVISVQDKITNWKTSQWTYNHNIDFKNPKCNHKLHHSAGRASDKKNLSKIAKRNKL